MHAFVWALHTCLSAHACGTYRAGTCPMRRASLSRAASSAQRRVKSHALGGTTQPCTHTHAQTTSSLAPTAPSHTVTHPQDPPPSPVWFHGGNSMLLDEGGGRYVYIGEVGFRFAVEPGDRIVDYVSPIGNSCVPYPFAVGEINTYFMLEPCYLPNSIMENYPPEKREDAYDVLYDQDLETWLPGAKEAAGAGAGGEGRRLPGAGAGLHAVGRMWKLRDREVVIQRSL